MNRNTKILLGIGALIVLGLAVGAYAFLVSPTKGPSSVLSSQQPTSTRPQMDPLAKVNLPTVEPVVLAEGQTRYRIVSEESSATFTLDEMLRGEPKTVVGTSTAHVSGEIGVNHDHLASSTIGTIYVNARTFETDTAQRNNMIRRAILKTENDANEFIVFKPTSISGTSTLLITGDLTIAGMTQPATFSATTTFDVDGTLHAHASSLVKRADFNLVIPNIPFVANVEEEVELALSIVAKPVVE